MDYQYCYSVSCGFYVLASLYYTLYLLKPGMNQQLDMNPLVKYIYRSVVSAYA